MQPVRTIVKATDNSSNAASMAADAPHATASASTGTTAIPLPPTGGLALLDDDEDLLSRLAAKQQKDETNVYESAANNENGPSPFTADFMSFRKPAPIAAATSAPPAVGTASAKKDEPPAKRTRLEAPRGKPRTSGHKKKKASGGSLAPLTGMGDSDSDDSALAFVLGGDRSDEEEDQVFQGSDDEDEDAVEEAGEIFVEDTDDEGEQQDGDRVVGDKSRRPFADESNGVGDSTTTAAKAYVRPNQQLSANGPLVIPRQKFKSTVFERFHSYGYGVHSLISLTEPLTLQGPCLILCVVQDALADGHSLRATPLVLPDYHHRVAVMPAKRRGKRPDLSGFSTGSQAVEELLTKDLTIEEAMLGGDRGMKVVKDADFGKIDWHWVHGKVQSWKQRLGTVPSSLLVLEPTSAYERRQFEGLDAGGADEGLVLPNQSTGVVQLNSDVPPKCFAKYKGEYMEPSVLNTTLPAVTSKQDTSIAVVGCSNIGKSTQLRFISNYLLSSNNASSVLWADFDLGQPEFALPGSISLYRINKFLFSKGCMTAKGGYHHAVGFGVSVRPDAEAEHLISFPLGSSGKLRCPVTASRAIAAMCDHILALRAQVDNSRVPLLINTHGWVMHTGRRATLEVLRRLQPKHVLHMLQPSEEPWCTPKLIGDVRSGLNEATITRRFTVSGASAMAPPPSCSSLDEDQDDGGSKGRGKSSQSHQQDGGSSVVSIHTLTVTRPLQRKRAAAIREVSWLDYLGLALDGSVLDTSSSQIVEVDLSRLGVVVTDGGLDGVPPVETNLSASSKKKNGGGGGAGKEQAPPPSAASFEQAALAKLRRRLLLHSVVVLASSSSVAADTVIPIESLSTSALPKFLGCGIIVAMSEGAVTNTKVKVILGARPSDIDLSKCNVLMVNPEEKRPSANPAAKVE